MFSVSLVLKQSKETLNDAALSVNLEKTSKETLPLCNMSLIHVCIFLQLLMILPCPSSLSLSLFFLSLASVSSRRGEGWGAFGSPGWALLLGCNPGQIPLPLLSLWRGFFCLEGSEWVYRGRQETKDVCMCVSLSARDFCQSFVTTEEIFRGDVSGINKTKQLSYGSVHRLGERWQIALCHLETTLSHTHTLNVSAHIPSLNMNAWGLCICTCTSAYIFFIV